MARARRSPARLGLALAAAAVLLDQLSKWVVVSVLAVADPIPVAPFFNLVMTRNRGVGFGLLDIDSPWTPWALSAVALAVSAGLAVWMVRAQGRWLAGGLGLVIGGALGNVIDRVRFGAVTDFLDVFIGRYHWPAFNLADAAITVGVAMILIDGLIVGRDRRNLPR